MSEPLKKHLSIQGQIAKFESRGLIIDDYEFAETFLEKVNYYRFSGYLFDFRKKGTDNYKDGIMFSNMAKIYEFDTKFTRLLMYILEDVEETLKTRFSYALSSSYPQNPLIYLDDSIYTDKNKFSKFKAIFDVAKNDNKKLPFIKHHFNKYGGDLPIWVAVEIMTMGNIKALYENLNTQLKKLIARKYKTGTDQLGNWIENLTYTRNHLAHYMRVYNYNFGRIPKSCRNHPINATYRGKIFDQIAVMSFMFSDSDTWNNYVLKEISELLDQYSNVIAMDGLGFPVNWDQVLTI